MTIIPKDGFAIHFSGIFFSRWHNTDIAREQSFPEIAQCFQKSIGLGCVAGPGNPGNLLGRGTAVGLLYVLISVCFLLTTIPPLFLLLHLSFLSY